MSRTVKKEGSRRISVSFPSVSTRDEENPKSNKLHVGAYCRVSSTSEEQLLSYHAQLEHYHKYLTNNPDYIFSGIYADEGVSGTKIKTREGFMKMLDDCRNHKLDMIITKSVSRFGRNTVDCLNVVRELKVLGIDVFFEKENIHSLRSEGELLLTLMMAVAEAESENMSSNIKWGKQRRYEQGIASSISGSSPFGYTRDKNGCFIISENEAAIIRRIYNGFLDGYGTSTIAKALNKDDVLSPLGGEWVIPTIKQILKNEKYKGDIHFLKTFITDPLTKKCIKNNGERNQYYLEDAHLAIIEKDLWECVQLEMARRIQFQKAHHKGIGNNKGDKYPFTGKLICKECGYSFLLKYTNRLEDNGKPRWRCGSFYKLRGKVERYKFTCHHLWLEQSATEQAFITSWNSLKKIEVDESADVLHQYRVQQLNQLLEEYGKITETHYELVLKTLDYIEVGVDGAMVVKFLAGIIITV
jgi:site-specific DNA recombinase